MGIFSKRKKDNQGDLSVSNQPADDSRDWLGGAENTGNPEQPGQPNGNITEEKIKAVEEYLDKEREKSFTKGMIAGAVGIAIVIVVATVIGWFPPGDGDVKLHALEEIVNKYYLFQEKVDEDAAKEATYKGFIDGLGDPYSVYMTEDEYKEFSKDLEGEFCGVGLIFTMDHSVDGAPARVTDVLDGYPAEKAGVEIGDIILSIDGKPIKDGSSTDVANLMRGKKGSKVSLGIYRESTKKQYQVDLTREEIKAYTVSEKVLDDGSGYIHVREFDRDTDKEFKKAVDRLLEKNVSGIIIDLRSNTGGLMDVTTEMLDYLLPKGKLVTTKYKDGSEDVVKGDNKHQVDLPMAVLINGMSASASEMFTGALQDYGKAVVVGTQSFGKGIVQNVYGLKDGSAVKITIAEYLTPKNRHIHKKGITPDIKVEDSRQSVIDPNDAQLRAAQKAIAK